MVRYEDVLAALGGAGRLVHVEHLPARPARHGELARPLAGDVGPVLSARARTLWSHQAAAIDLLRDGTSVVVATGTASGKSLCYQLPIAEAVAAEPPGTALALYPTKALAQDQLRAFTDLGVPGLVACAYDGDTGPEARVWARRNANVVLTNPEMLHTGILPYHGRWATFLRRLRFVVIDELHVLRGIFGTHVAHVVRRLRRLAARYGADPVFAFSSATIGEPAQLASALCAKPVSAVVDDGSPRGERLFALWNPPLVDAELGVRASPNAEAAALCAELVSAGARTVVFCRSRRATETVAAMVRRRLGAGHEDAVRAYRAGYLASERREVEAELFSGTLEAVVATSALELGIDVGTLDAGVLNGFPGTIASLWQQAGRAGRQQQRSLAVLVAGTDQLDQWLMANPREVLTRPAEPAVVNLRNPFVREAHLASAAYEAPLVPEDRAWWGDDLDEGVRDLVVSDRLRVREGRAYWCGRGSPAPGIGLRSGTSAVYRIVTAEGRLVGTVDGSRAFEVVHPGALYLHQGATYRVVGLDLDEHEATVEAVDTEDYTQVRADTTIAVLGVDACRPVGGVRLHLGTVEVCNQVVGYERRRARTGHVLEAHDLDLPASSLVTRSFWYTVPDEVIARARVGPDALAGALHAAEHAGIGILPLFTICDRWDVGGVSTAAHAATGLATVFVYDGFPGGAGIAELGYDAGRRHFEATLAVVERCRCRAGCPSCVQSPKCGNGNEPLDKAGAVALLRAVLAG